MQISRILSQKGCVKGHPTEDASELIRIIITGRYADCMSRLSNLKRKLYFHSLLTLGPGLIMEHCLICFNLLNADCNVLAPDYTFLNLIIPS